ncbi:MAG: nucleotidyltransferase domain-containing protein [Chitinophagaceae bacterium]|jgi:hypothetical protein|nr:nucleotidyltransferase domain-containing protein [Chitinophagaceae bacterium]
MHPIIEQNKSAIIALCQKHRVKELFVFGSALRDDFGPESDIDFQVTYSDASSATEQFETYITLKSELEKLLHREVDLIEQQSLRNKYLRYFINLEKKPLYAEA